MQHQSTARRTGSWPEERLVHLAGHALRAASLTTAALKRHNDIARQRLWQRIVSRLRHPIAIDVERDCRLSVTQPARHLHHRHPGSQPRDGRGIPQVMQSDALSCGPRGSDRTIAERASWRRRRADRQTHGSQSRRQDAPREDRQVDRLGPVQSSGAPSCASG